MYRLTDGRTDWRPHFYFLTNVSCWWGNYSCCILLWRISSLQKLAGPPGRRWASAPWWCCLGPGPSGARPGSCDSYHLQFFSDDTIDDYERWDRLRFGKLSNVEIDEKSLHIRKFFYVCRWCEAVQEFNYLKMTRKWSCSWYLMQMRDLDDDEKNVDDENRLCKLLQQTCFVIWRHICLASQGWIHHHHCITWWTQTTNISWHHCKS